MTARPLLAVVLACAGCGGDAERFDTLDDDRRHFGYVHALDVDAEPPELTFDPAEFLVGAQAERAARDDGAIGPDEPLSNDYFIRNPSRATLRLRVEPDVSVSVVRCETSCREGVPGEVEPLAASFALDEAPTLTDDYRGRHTQYWLTVVDGVVVGIDEQYLP